MATGCYTEPYLPGSYKLIPFKAMDVSSEHGRRGAEGEFPFGERTAYADLGRKIRRYSIRARFDSNAHVLEAAALIAAVETTGPGILTHPTRGVILSAACTSLRVSDKVEEEQGVTYVDMDFVEANEWPNGLSLIGQLAGFALGTIIGSARTHFNSSYAPASVQPYRKAEVVDTAQAQVTNIRTQYAAATTAKSSELSRNRILYDLEVIATDDSVAEDVSNMDKGLSLGMNAIAMELSGLEQYRVFKDIANIASQVSSLTGKAGESENTAYSTVRVIAASYMAEGALEAEQTRTGIVYDQLDAITAILDQEAAYARGVCANQYHLDILKFRNEVATQLYAKAYDSPGLVEYDFGGSTSPLTAAYSIFGDAKRHREIETLNLVSMTGRVGPLVNAARSA